MNIMAWKYPPGRGLEVVIEEMKLYPVTSFEGLLGELQVKKLMSQGLITVKDIVHAYRQGNLGGEFRELYEISRDILG